MKTLLIIIFLNAILNEAKSARILCVFPMPSISHQIVFKAYTQALAKRGHELVILATNPTLPKERPKDNITEIDIGAIAFSGFEKVLNTVKSKGLTKHGFIYNMKAYTDSETVNLFSTICSEQFKLPEVRRLLEDPNQKFDLIIMESIIEFPLILSKIFKAPVIYFSTFYGTSENLEMMGAISRHPFLFPQSHRNNFGGVSIWQKLKEIYWDWKLFDFYRKVKENTDRLIKDQFGVKSPSLKELRQNVDLLFLNINPIFDNNRPVPPNVVYLGALHLQPAKQLPEDLKSIVEKSKNGVVYVSFGTIIKPSQMTKELLNEFYKAFAALPYNILWKFDTEFLENKPDNVIIKKWVPQRDLLKHPNIKAFVTQGGLQSLDEAIDAGVPIVGIPMVADQWFNLYQCSKMGVSVELDATSLTAEDLTRAIKNVIQDNSYKENIVKIRSLMYDQFQSPMERALWWTEYVIRHGGAKHLRSPSANMSWDEYFMIDIIIPFVAVTLVIIVVLILMLFYSTRLVLRIFKVKVKQN